MSKEKIVVVSKGKVRLDNSDGTYTELDFILPHEVAKIILCDIIEWKDNYLATPNEVESYQTAEKEFLKKLQNEK